MRGFFQMADGTDRQDKLLFRESGYYFFKKIRYRRDRQPFPGEFGRRAFQAVGYHFPGCPAAPAPGGTQRQDHFVAFPEECGSRGQAGIRILQESVGGRTGRQGMVPE